MIRGSNPVWSYVDLTGKQFDDTFYMWVLENDIPYIPATVYQDPSGNTPWDNPIRFLANGTLPVDIYWNPNVIYRLEFRQTISGPPTQADPLIYLIENYIPGAAITPPPIDTVALATENQITNPQFVIINFVSPFVLINVTDPDPIPIAPGWDLVLSGTGNVNLTRIPLNDSALTINPTNAPYAIVLSLNGTWTADQCFLRQRFQQNGMLWANKTVSSSTTARTDGITTQISSSLVDSNGTPLTTVLTPIQGTVNGTFTELQGFGTLPQTTNPDLPPAAYIDYLINLPNNVNNLYLTSLQLIVQNVAVNIAYEQDTVNRQIDQTFNYYNPLLQFKPIPSYLVGWDFPLNPAQFAPLANGGGTTGAIGSNKSIYAWDQTILFSSITSGLSYVRAGGDTALAFQVTPVSDTSWAMIQYVPKESARILLSQSQTVAFLAYATSGTVNGSVSLWYTKDANLPNINIGTYDSLVSSITSGFPTCGGGPNGTWVQVIRNLGNATFTLTGDLVDVNFSGWQEIADSESDAATYMAIVMAFDTTLTTQDVVFDYVSLMAGDIATRPAPVPADETLRQCQYYYEKSYDSATVVGTGAITNGLCTKIQTVFNNTNVYPETLTLTYNTVKRTAIPKVNFYDYAGTVDKVTAQLINNNSSVGRANGISIAPGGAPNWTQSYLGSKAATYQPANAVSMQSVAAAQNVPSGWIEFHYVVDARLGIAN